MLNNFDTGKRKATQHFLTENERRAAVNQACAPRLEQSGASGGNAADMEGCDEAAAERKRAERSFATAAGHEGAVVLRPCGLREG